MTEVEWTPNELDLLEGLDTKPKNDSRLGSTECIFIQLSPVNRLVPASLTAPTAVVGIRINHPSAVLTAQPVIRY
jgi:hypothetical protein